MELVAVRRLSIEHRGRWEHHLSVPEVLRDGPSMPAWHPARLSTLPNTLGGADDPGQPDRCRRRRLGNIGVEGASGASLL